MAKTGSPQETSIIVDGPFPGQTPSGDWVGISEALPADLLDQVRARVRLIAGLLFLAFVFDPLLYFGAFIIAHLWSLPVDPNYLSRSVTHVVGLSGAVASGAVWWLARSGRLPPSRLYRVSHVYEVLICLVIGWVGSLDYYRAYHHLPDQTWVPVVVILFALLLPGSPRRVLTVVILSSVMPMLGILLLTAFGLVVATTDDYVNGTVHTVFTIIFAYMASTLVYGLGREVVKARELGSYRLGELLGRGGMGEVYRATHRMLARPAAIKLIRPEMLKADPAGPQMAITRFRREAEAAASLRSPHTVELYDFGVTSDQTFFCVMELLEGTDLESLVRKKGPLPPERVIYLLRQVCESLEEAHAGGLVHRDIKPANIHLGRLGLRHDFVKVLDFGLVKSIDRESGEDSLATAKGAVAGTPSYMAPEVAMGEGFDGRADIYALGCVGYFLLTGRGVFEAPNHMAMVVKHMRDIPQAPSGQSELPIPPALDRVILQCLSKTPGDRPTARDLARILDEIETPPWGEEQALQWWTINRTA